MRRDREKRCVMLASTRRRRTLFGRLPASPVGTAGLLFTLVLAIGAALPTAAQEGPIPIRNGLPAAQIFGLPRMLGGELVEAAALTLNTEVANVFTSSSNATSYGFFDGETTVISAGYRRPLGRRFEIGVEIPYVVQHGGHLDPWIDDFHELFGFPQGGRQDAPNNKIDYVIRSRGTTYVDFQDSEEGFGDIRLLGGYQWLAAPDRALAVRGLVKLATGDPDKLTGSGAADGALWLDFTDRRWLSRFGMTVTLGAGLLVMGDGDIVPRDQERTAGFGHVGLGLPLSRRFTLLAQLDGHTTLIDTGLDQVSGAALQGTVGLRFRGERRFWGDFSLSEDLIGNSSPDVVFQLLLGARL